MVLSGEVVDDCENVGSTKLENAVEKKDMKSNDELIQALLISFEWVWR